MNPTLECLDSLLVLVHFSLTLCIALTLCRVPFSGWVQIGIWHINITLRLPFWQLALCLTRIWVNNTRTLGSLSGCTFTASMSLRKCLEALLA